MMLKDSDSGMQGFDMRIDMNGDAIGNYTFLSHQTVKAVTDDRSNAYYPFDKALDITADFLLEEGKTLPKLRFSREVVWPDGKLPLDEPPCGFNGDKCIKHPDPRLQIIMLCISLAIVAILVASSFIIYR